MPEVYRLPFSATGFNHNPNIDEIPPTSLVYPSRNMNLNKNGAESRGGTSKVDSAKYGGAKVMGGYDFTIADGTQFRVVVTTDGKIWKDTTTTIHTGWTAGQYVHFEVYNFKLYISNGVDMPQIWDGSAAATSSLQRSITGTDIAFVDSNPDTITTVGGNFVTSGFLAGMTITVSGSTSNDGTYTIDTVAATTITLISGDTLSAEAAGASVTITGGTPADWTGANHPQVIILHGRGNSERLWAFGVASKPNVVYYSANNDGISDADFSEAAGGTILVGSGTLKGGIEFGDRLLVWDNLRSYVIDDTNATPSNWGYAPSQFKSGLADFKLVIETENDLVCMQEDGTIYSATAVESYGDYKMASLTKPAYIDEWIREYIDLTKISQFHMTYDPTLRCIKVFMVYKGDTTVKMALPYFIDKGPEKGWGPPHDNKNYASGYDAVCSFLYRASTGSYKIYTGDSSGNVWDLETSTKNDDSNDMSAWARTPRLVFEDSRMTKRYMKGWLLTKAQGSYNVSVDITVFDSQGNTKTKSVTVSLNTGQAVWGAVNWGAFSWADAEAIIDQVFRINRVGKRIQFDFYNNNADEPFFLSSSLTDFRFLGARIN